MYSSNNIGLYRDDVLSVFRNISRQQAEKHKKVIQKIFRDKSSQIIIKCDLKIVDYLDVTLNLNDGTYRPFINLIRKQLTSMSNLTIPRKLSKIFQDRVKKDYPAYLQQRKYLKIRKITMSSVYGNTDITKN